MRIWLNAARPRTLPAAIAPVFVGTAAAYSAAVSASGRLSRQETFQVLGAAEATPSLERAAVVSRAYRPPGAPADWRVEYDALG